MAKRTQKTRRRRYRGGHWFKTRPVSRKCQWSMPWSKKSDCCKFQFNLERSKSIKLLKPETKARFLALCRETFDSLSNGDLTSCIKAIKQQSLQKFDEESSHLINDAIESAALFQEQEVKNKVEKLEREHEHKNQYTGRQSWWNRSDWFK